MEKSELVTKFQKAFRGKTATKIEYSLGCDFAVRYHNTDVVKIDLTTRKATLDNGGWATPTTKERINHALRLLGVEGGVFQKDYYWYYDTAAGVVEFRRGMVIDF